MKQWVKGISFILLSFLFMMTSACHKVVGNGEEVTKTQKISSLFNKIRIDGFYQINIVQGNTQSLSITTDKNIHPLIVVAVKNGQLIIHNLVGYSFSVAAKPVIDITVKNLKALKISGDVRAKIQGFKEDQFTLFVAGTSNIDFESRVNNLLIRLTGASFIYAKNAVIDNAEVHVDGVGKIVIRVNGNLETYFSGAGNITYFGKPTSIKQHSAGVGVLQQGVENSQ